MNNQQSSVKIPNCKVMSNKLFTFKGDLEMSRMFVTSYNRIPRKQGEPKFEDIAFSLVVWNPNDTIKALENGDRVVVDGARFRIDSNPNMIQVHKDNLGDKNAKTSPSKFIEVIADNDQITVQQKEDPTVTETEEETTSDLPF